MGGRMHYTIDKLVMLKDDKEVSIDPKDYADMGKNVIADEIIAFMTAHMGDMTWRLGSTTSYGPHSFMLTMFPSIENLRFWVQAKRMKGEVRLDCNGDLEVIIKGNRLTPPRGADTSTVPAQKKVVNQKSLDEFISKRIKRLFK